MDHSHSPLARLAFTFAIWGAIAGSSLAADPTRQLLDPSRQEAPDGRLLSVRLNDGALSARVNSLGLTSVAGGIVPLAIEGSVNDKRNKNASTLLAPITAAMTDVNMNEEVTRASLQMAVGIPWLNANLDGGEGSQVNDTRQRLILDYGILMEPKFDAMQLNLLVQLVSPGTKKNEVLFRQYLICFVPLQAPDVDPAKNSQRWAKDNAALVRAALDIGLSRLGKMTARGLHVTKSESDSIKSLKSYRVGYSKKAAENHYGKIVLKDETGTMIETQFGDWVYYFWPTRETKGAL